MVISTISTRPGQNSGIYIYIYILKIYVENIELIHECRSQHLRKGTAELKRNTETDDDRRKMNVERSEVSPK